MMSVATQDTQISLYKAPKPTTLKQVTAQNITSFLVAGIVNPFGPTLNVVAAAGELDPGIKLPVVRMMLNPFSQEVQTVGELTVGESWRPSTVIYPMFDLPFGSCPTLLLPSRLLDAEHATLLYAEFLRRFDDARRVLEDVEQYLGNPWDRVSMEMRRATAQLKKRKTAVREPLDEKEAAKLGELLLSEKHVKAELQAFLYAWGGSIEHTVPGLATLSSDEFAHIFAHLTVSCRTPALSGNRTAARPPSDPSGTEGAEQGEEDASRIQGDVGPEVLKYVAEKMQLNSDWCVAEARSITWWGHTLAQRIWADPVFNEDGDHIVRIHAQSDFLRDVRESLGVPKLLSELNSDAALSGFVWKPEQKTIKLRCSAFVHSQNVGWFGPLFAWAVAIQAAEAHSLASSVAKRIGAAVDTSVHPMNGPRHTPDEMLGLSEFLANPPTKETPTFGREDFNGTLKLGHRLWVMANVEDDGFTAEFPFTGCIPPTALFTANRDAMHPRLGKGLLLLLRLPLVCSPSEAEAIAVKLNSAELVNQTRAHFMGAWCVDTERNHALIEKGVMLVDKPVPSSVVNERARSTLSFCAFLPSAVRQPSVFPNLAFSMAHRVRWANEFLASESGAPALFGPRDKDSYKIQSEQRTSVIGGLLSRLKRQPKRNPN